MKYWGYLVLKLALAVGLLYPALIWIGRAFPTMRSATGRADPVIYLHYEMTMWAFWLVATGTIWLIIWDQRYRCRTCVRRLRMPIQRGSWTNVLLGAPHTEYICPYGHGTLSVADLQITGHQEPDWEPHEDMWKELVALDESKK
jgi:hypothetical protein